MDGLPVIKIAVVHGGDHRAKVFPLGGTPESQQQARQHASHEAQHRMQHYTSYGFAVLPWNVPA